MTNTNLSTLLKVELDKSGIRSELRDIQKIVDKYPVKLTTDLQNSQLKKQYESFCQKMADELNKTFQSKLSGQDIFNVYESNARQLETTLDKTGTSVLEQLDSVWTKFCKNYPLTGFLPVLISEILRYLPGMEKTNALLAQIGKTSGMTDKQLQQLGADAYALSDRYGKTADSYLSEMQTMERAGFSGKKGSALAEQSLLVQSAGNMSAELADSYILAANAAYKLNGEAEKINEIVDGQNNIAAKNHLAFADMAAAMSLAGNAASHYKVSLEDVSAMIGVLASSAKLDGPRTGNAVTELLQNLQNTSSDTVVSTLDKANVSMTELVNGSEKLRNPIDILRDLSAAFCELDDSQPLKGEILSNIGGENQAASLAALLENMDTYDKMLLDYSRGSGSALAASNQNVETLTGSITTLQNSWMEFLNSIASSDILENGANLLNSLVQGTAELAETLTPVGAIGAGAGLFASLKNVGSPKMFGLCHLF